MNVGKFLKKFDVVGNKVRKATEEITERFEAAMIREGGYSETRSNQSVFDDGDNSYVYESSRFQEPKTAKIIVPSSIANDKKYKHRITESGNNWYLLGTGGAEDSDRVLSLEELQSLQDSCFKKVHTDPHIKSAVNNVRFFTIGRGMKFEASNEKVQDVLLNFWVLNDMDKRQKDMVKSTYVEGEYFILYYVNESTGKIKIRKIACKEIDGIETHPTDIETVLTYSRSYIKNDSEAKKIYQDFNYEIQLEDGLYAANSKNSFDSDKYVQFIKYGEENEVRGRPPMDSILQWSKLYKDWMYDRARLNHERSKVVWIKTVNNPKEIKDKNSGPMRVPRGGIMLVETNAVKYRIEHPQINADEAKDDGEALMRMMGSGISIPPYILDQNADAQVYGSIRKADTPFTQMITDNQDFWANQFDKMFRFVIRKNVEAGILPEKVKVPQFTSQKKLEEIYNTINEMYVEGKSIKKIVEEVKNETSNNTKEVPVETTKIAITKIFPEPVKEDELDKAKVLEIHRRVGLASIQSLSEKAGYNWKEELYRMLTDKRNDEEPDKYSRDPKNVDYKKDSSNVDKK